MQVLCWDKQKKCIIKKWELPERELFGESSPGGGSLDWKLFGWELSHNHIYQCMTHLLLCKRCEKKRESYVGLFLSLILKSDNTVLLSKMQRVF